ncbi:hypothetical protein O3W44_00260 [Pantoea sp. LMR881]|uniref:hypothetical protein n=1 Tax=Pantoea sp. LMR881 TaxID=3014336 RepID=UPI0022AEAF2D|nr:hypothetical protein [Pantoea sp. LMR881]MCZ4057836.1 hypothetical protein [Pantoea sp. LMR881]
MTLTDTSAASARPDETESQQCHRKAMQDASQQIRAKYGERFRLEPRTKETLDSRRKERATKEYARQAAFYPQRPRIVVTRPDVVLMDYASEIRGRFGAVVQD